MKLYNLYLKDHCAMHNQYLNCVFYDEDIPLTPAL